MFYIAVGLVLKCLKVDGDAARKFQLELNAYILILVKCYGTLLSGCIGIKLNAYGAYVGKLTDVTNY